MKRIALLAILMLLAISCSTTKLLPEGTYRLVSNKVEFSGHEKLPSTEVTSYLRQQPNKSFLFGWSPALSIYNWSNGSGEGINKFWESLGEAPVVFDPSLVESSRANIIGNLQALGYYGSKVDAEISYQDRLARVKYIVTPGKRIRIDLFAHALCHIHHVQNEDGRLLKPCKFREHEHTAFKLRRIDQNNGQVALPRPDKVGRDDLLIGITR